MDLFSDAVRRNPFPVYDALRTNSPVLRVPPPFNGWMIFDYESVKWTLNDHETFSSRVPAPNWFIFFDPPAHTKLRGLISRAFTPRMIANLEVSIQALSRELLDRVVDRGEMDVTADFSVPMSMRVISGMIGIPQSDWARYKRWSDTILFLSYSRSGGEQAERALRDFMAVSAEMGAYLGEMVEERSSHPQDDLLTRLIEAEVDGKRLSHEEILGFFQLLMVAGQETTSNLIDNAVISFLENPEQLARLREDPALMEPAIEEVLRFRSPLQWVMRAPRREIELHGVTIPGGSFLLPVIGSANRDPSVFANANCFDITRDPNPHIAFGHGIHFCLGAALTRLEARVALTDLLDRCRNLAFASSQPWQPRHPLQVLGPASLPVRFDASGAAAGR